MDLPLVKAKLFVVTILQGDMHTTEVALSCH